MNWSELLSLASALVIPVAGWFVAGQRALRSSVRDLEIRITRVETRDEATATALVELKSSLDEVRDNMAKHQDMVALSARIDALRGRS